MLLRQPADAESRVRAELRARGVADRHIVFVDRVHATAHLARMASAEELLGTFVFSELHEFVVPKLKADGSPSSAKEARVNTANGVVLLLDKDGDAQFEAIQSTRAEDFEVDVKSRSPAVGEARDWTSAEDLVLDVESRNPAVGEASVTKSGPDG